MCRICHNPVCFGCGPKETPPSGLTDKERKKNGWEDNVTQEELDRIKANARNAVENPNNAFDGVFGRR